MKQLIKITSWNVQSLTDGKPRLLALTAASLRIDIIIMMETRRAETHGEKATQAYSYWCTEHDGTSNHGVGFMVHKDIKVLDFKKCRVGNSDSRAAQPIIETKKGKRSLYALYAPHIGHGEDTIRKFWEDAQDLPCINKSIVGIDANGHVHPLGKLNV